MNASEPEGAISREMTDEEVVRRVVGGEVELFELLMRRYNQRIFRAVRAMLPNAEDAEDVMQQAYVAAYRHLEQFEGRSSFATWLTRIALREGSARNRTRQSRLRVVQPSTEGATMNDFPEPGPDPESRAATSELMRHVEAEMAALPERYRAVLLLREVEGLSTDETAACLDVSADVVKTRLHRARTMLRDALYARAGGTLHSTFTFGAHRCDRLVARVMQELRVA